MISDKVQKAIAGSSAIRAMFVEGQEMAKMVGAENVYDFSLGNPATAAPKAVGEAMKDIIDKQDSLYVHGYMANAGYPEVREAIARNLNQRFDTDLDGHNILMTVGAAGGLNSIMKTLFNPGEECMVFLPYFGEYRGYAQNFEANIVEVESDKVTFQPDFTDFKNKITDKTKAVIINTPNNPTGVIYTQETMEHLAVILEQKEQEYGHEIYLISDEPYRELVYGENQEQFIAKYYHNTIVGYSFSKSLSLPGERIGYVAVPNTVTDADTVIAGIEVSIRTLGYVNAPSLMQLAVARCLDEKTDVAYYDRNRVALYEGLTNLGYTCVKPDGAFYLWVKSPIENEEEFVATAKKHHILVVKGSAFGCSGFVRIAYCVAYEKITGAMSGFESLAKEYHLI